VSVDTVRNPTKSKAATIALVALKFVWQASRYALATSVTALALAIPPVFVVLILTIAGGVCTVAFSLLMLASGISGTADPPLFALLLAVIVPVGFVVAVVAIFVAVIVGVILFTGLLVLPLSLLTEVMLPYIPVRSTFGRMASFLSVGGLAGLVIGALWVFLNPRTDILTVGIIGVVLFLACICSVGLFGTVLTMAETVRKVLGTIIVRLSAQRGTK